MKTKDFRKLWWADEGGYQLRGVRREDEWGRRGTSRMHHLSPRHFTLLCSLGQWLNSNSALFVSRVPKKGGVVSLYYR
jgi:hypothetical protein